MENLIARLTERLDSLARILLPLRGAAIPNAALLGRALLLLARPDTAPFDPGRRAK